MEESMRNNILIHVTCPLWPIHAGKFHPNKAIMNATMVDILLIMGYAPNQWKKGLNVMRQKKAGNINMENF